VKGREVTPRDDDLQLQVGVVADLVHEPPEQTIFRPSGRNDAELPAQHCRQSTSPASEERLVNAIQALEELPIIRVVSM
jgi:hypothetical protein